MLTRFLKRDTEEWLVAAARMGLAAAVVVVAMLSGGCRQKMADQPSYRPLQESDFWPDGRSSRAPVPGTVARGQLREDEAWFTGKRGTEFVNLVPRPVTREMLQRGRERYDIFCSPCHDRLGNGQGMVVRRGFPPPPSLHIDRLREARPGYVFDVITRGFGRQAEMASQIPVEDRWAITAYLKVLQFSQHAPLSVVPAADRPLLDKGPASPPPPPEEMPAPGEKEP
ncbi:MAG TPA: cytochrome c [Candidatus Polarisedimenticolia bacterium]|nr:cytochrome c [Candidatus Polarisedimenticolia bacterium]